MSDNQSPIIMSSNESERHIYDDIFVNVPFKKKNSPALRQIAKECGAKFQSYSERWVILRNNLTQPNLNIISKNNLFGGYKFSSEGRVGINDCLNQLKPGSYRFNCLLNKIGNNIDKSKSKVINFSPQRSVLFTYNDSIDVVTLTYCYRDSNFFQNAQTIKPDFFSVIYKNYHHRTEIIPLDYGREIWKYYTSKPNSSVEDVHINLFQNIVTYHTKFAPLLLL